MSTIVKRGQVTFDAEGNDIEKSQYELGRNRVKYLKSHKPVQNSGAAK